MVILISDQEFLGWFDLSRPAMVGARELSEVGRTHEAAMAAARAATEGPVRGVIHGRDVGATGALIAKHFPRSIDLEMDTLRLWEMPDIPSSEKLGVREDARIGHRARTGRRRPRSAVLLLGIFDQVACLSAITLPVVSGAHHTRHLIDGSRAIAILLPLLPNRRKCRQTAGPVV